MRSIFLYGPPGSGKSTLGKVLAERLGLPFQDLDRVIERNAGRSVRRIFAESGEAAFRALERKALEEVSGEHAPQVVALGGGALLDPACRACAEACGDVLLLACPPETLRARVARAPGVRPLVADDGAAQLDALLARRAAHYASFPRRLSTGDVPVHDVAREAEIVLGAYRIDSGDVPSRVSVGVDALDTVGDEARALNPGARAVVVTNRHTAACAARVAASLDRAGVSVSTCEIPAGEAAKTLETVQTIWRAFLAAGLGRADLAVAVGGGVTGDLTGFAAATWMRGIRWINVPTTLLAMVDASTGGKTGCDLPEGKNLIGAFHAPSCVLADVMTLRTLPAREWRCGLAEAIKHAFIADPALLDALLAFAALATQAEDEAFFPACSPAALAAFVSRALSVKVQVVRRDPLERGERATLNLGHTVGHAVEIASSFGLAHGEAVAIGTVAEAALAVRLGLAGKDWPEQVAAPFARVGLPVALPAGMTFAALKPIMSHDKKKLAGSCVKFALPCRPGDVRLVEVDLCTI